MWFTKHRYEFQELREKLSDNYRNFSIENTVCVIFFRRQSIQQLKFNFSLKNIKK